MRTTIIHDNRLLGAITAALLARRSKRNHECVEISLQDRPSSHRQLWKETLPGLLQHSGQDKLILCGITFAESDPRGCTSVLTALKERFELEVWTHRWPDGYATALGSEPFVPQYDCYTSCRQAFREDELHLLRLAASTYQDVPSAELSPDERHQQHALSVEFSASCALFDRLCDLETDVGVALAALRNANPPAISAPLPDEVYEMRSQSPLVIYWADDSVRQHEEALLTQASHRYRLSDSAMAIGISAPMRRLYLCRPFANGTLPSVEELVHENRASCPEMLRGIRWQGPQDARHVDLLPSSTDNDLQVAADALRSWVEHDLSKATTGTRLPPAGLNRLLHEVAVDMLRRADILEAYSTSHELEFDPGQTRLRIDIGSRSAQTRRTLVLHLRASSTEALRFVFGYGAENLSRLETALEGSLAALKAGSASWLGYSQLPERVRIDVHAATLDLSSFSAALGDRSTSTVKAADHLNLVAPGGPLDRALRALAVEAVVVSGESSTIGPSIPYALLCSELSRVVRADLGGRPIDVLDLFAGSGVTARALVLDSPEIRVVSVDLMISADDVGLQDNRSVTWLRSDVRAVLRPGGTLDKDFDVVCMDPPHTLLFDLLLAKDQGDQDLLGYASGRSEWLVLYVGHMTQRGRREILERVISERFRSTKVIRWVQVASEIILVAGPADRAAALISSAMAALAPRAAEFGWEVCEVAPFELKNPRVG